MPTLPPRLVIAGTHSGVGKTTVATGIMAALTAAGLRVGAAKVGPDFIDPGYHAVAARSTPRNLDSWMCGLDAMSGLAERAGAGRDLLVIEGVMGLFDGAADGTPSSTADIAVHLDAPIVLVVDASASSHSIGAVVHGFHTYRRDVRIAGVVLNRVGSDNHEELARSAVAMTGIPVVGVLRRDDRLSWRDRHLGLIPVVERRNEVARSIALLGATIASRCDLAAIETIARGAPTHAVTPLDEAGAHRDPAVRRPVTRIALASGPAFSFTYPDNLEALERAGAELVPFDPLEDGALPDCQGLVVGGGFPEVYGEALSANTPLLQDVSRHIDRGLTTWAECAGLLWLSKSLDGRSLVGAIDAHATMSDRVELGYREATFERDTPLGAAGTVVRGHEFHYSRTDPAGDLLTLVGRRGPSRAGHGGRRLFASYLHLHLAGHDGVAEAFVDTALSTPYVG